MVKRYPHTATFTLQGTTSQVNGRTQEESQATFTINVRYEPSGAGSYVTNSSGNMVKLSGVIYTKELPQTVTEKDEVTVLNRSYKILRVHEYQKYVAVWV